MPTEFDSLYTTDYGLLGLEKNRIRLESWTDDSTVYDRTYPYEISRGCVYGHKAFFDIREGQMNKPLDSGYRGPEAEINPEELSGLGMKTIVLDLVSGQVEKELSFPNRQFPVIFLEANGPLGLWLELVSGNLYLADFRTEEIRKIFP